MIKNKFSNQGFFTAANSPTNQNEGLKGGSVSGNSNNWKIMTDDVCEIVMEYASVAINDSTSMKSAIAVSTAQISGTNLVYGEEESENNSLLFFNRISTVAKNIKFGGLIEDNNQPNGTSTIMSGVLNGDIDLNGGLSYINGRIKKFMDELIFFKVKKKNNLQLYR